MRTLEEEKKRKTEYMKKWRLENREKMKTYDRARWEVRKLSDEYKNYKNNEDVKARKREYTKKYTKANKSLLTRNTMERERRDPVFKLKRRLRNRLYCVLKNKRKIGSAVNDLGCTGEELAQYLESKFTKGMSWDNHGKWHIDHIRPLASFDLTKREEFLLACHYTNLQPLWAKDNLSKRDKIIPSQEGA